MRGLDIVVAIDTSRSMLAEDVAPNRLTRAKLAAQDLKRIARSDRIGLVAFAGSAFLQCPLSYDDDAFRQSLDELDVNTIPQGGTALAEAIQSALGAFKDRADNHKIMVIFTDGEDHDENAVASAKTAAKEGLTIFTIGVGTSNGELLRVKDAKGRVDYVRDDQGNVWQLAPRAEHGISGRTRAFGNPIDYREDSFLADQSVEEKFIRGVVCQDHFQLFPQTELQVRRFFVEHHGKHDEAEHRCGSR